MLMNPKGSPLFIFRHYATFSKFFQKKVQKNFFKKNFKIFLFPVGKSDFRHIEHERHTLGVSKVFSKLFMNTSWAYLDTEAKRCFATHDEDIDYFNMRIYILF